MPFDLKTAQPATTQGFKIEGAKPAVSPDFVSPDKRRERIAALDAERAALPNPNTPVRNYLKDWGGAVKDAVSGPLVSDKGIAHDLVQGVMGLGETAASLGTGLTSLVTEPLEELVTGKRVDRGAHVYQPRTEGGRAQAELIGAAGKPLGDYFGTAVPEGIATGAEELGASPELAEEIGRGGERVLEAATMFSPAKLRGGKPPVIAPGAEGVQAGRAATGTVTDRLPQAANEPQQVARAAGVSVLPSSVPKMRNVKGKVLERLSGSPQAAVNFSIKNEPRLQAHAREDIGLKGSSKITEPELQKAREPHEAVYDELRDTVPVLTRDAQLESALDTIGSADRNNQLLEVAPDVERLRERMAQADKSLPSKDVLEAVRRWRKKARTLYKSADDPAKHEQAEAFQNAADAFEDALGRAAEANGKPDLGQRFKQARQGLAKINDVEDALVDGQVNVGEFAKMEKAGKKLTGRIKLLADLGRWFERETQPTPGLSMPEHQSVPLFRVMMGRAVQAMGRGPIDDILANEFGRYQRQFGERDMTPGPGSPLGAYFEAPPQRPAPRGPMGPEGSGSVDFSGSPNVPPAAALRPGERIEFARDMSGDASIPAAEARLGDLTASEPPLPEGIPFGASPEIMNVQGPRAPAPIGTDIAGSGGGFFPGAEVPPNAALVEWLTDQPLERRREGGRPLVEEPNPPFAGNGGRPFPDDGTPPTAPGRPGEPTPLELADEYTVPDRSAERDRVLQGDAMKVDAMLGDLFARFPDLEREVRGDTMSNAQTAMNRRIEDRGGKRQPRGPNTPRRRRDDPDADEEGEGAPVAPKKPPEGGEGGAAASLGDLFHGTGARFSNFDPSRIGSNTGNPTTRLGVSLASTLEDAQHYARLAAEKGGEPQVMRVKADVQRPYQMTARELDQLAMKLMEGEDVAIAAVEQLRERLVAEGYDSIVVSTPRNPQKEVIVFDANKVKRAPLFDPHGQGGVPDSQNIGHMGFERMMTPDEFLGLAERIPPGQERMKSLEFLRNLANEGGQFGNPFLSGAEWDAAAKAWRVRGQHEGRHRTMIARERGETQIPVHIFPRGGIRRHELTQEQLDAPILWKDETAGPLAGLGDEFERVIPEMQERARRQKLEELLEQAMPEFKPEPLASPDASIQATIDELRGMGWSDPEINELLNRGG